MRSRAALRRGAGMAAVASIAVLAVAGCSSGGGGSNGSPRVIAYADSQPGATTPSSSTAPMPVANGVACTLVSRVEATALFGHPATRSVPADPGGAASVCLWKADAAPGTVGDVAYLLQVHVYADALHYSEKVYPNARHLSDIGDRAIAVDEGMGIYAVQFVKGGRTVTIAYSVNAIGGDTHAKAATQSNEVIALARTAAGRI